MNKASARLAYVTFIVQYAVKTAGSIQQNTAKWSADSICPCIFSLENIFFYLH